MNEEKDVVDFFTEELSKKEKKLEKKKEKERKLKEKKNKKLEKMEDIEFAKRLEAKKNNDELSSNSLEMTRSNLFNSNIKKEKKYPILNFILGLFLIILFLVSCDYFVYSVLKEKETEIIVTSSLLCCLSICYILSIIIKKEPIKKSFQILATISIATYMAYYLFIV